MSINKASETWDMLEPFAQRWLEGMLGDGKSGDPAKDGYFIILYDASGQVKREYSFSLDGLNAALAAAESGDVVWLPAGSLATDITVPEGVAVVGDGMNCIIAGTVILGAGAELRDMTVEVSDDLESEIVAVIGPDSGTAYIWDCVIFAYSCGATNAIGVQAQSGNVILQGCEVNGESVSGQGYAISATTVPAEPAPVPTPEEEPEEEPEEDPDPPVVPDPPTPPETEGAILVSPGSSIQAAINAASAGAVILLRAGTWAEKVTVDKAITLAGYPGETAVIDGQYSDSIVPYWGVLLNVTADNAIVQDLEVKRSQWMGVKLTGEGTRATNIYSHHNMENGILATGDDAVIEYCDVYYNCMSNENGIQTRTGWASGCTAARTPTGVTMRFNKVHHNWGEGLSTYEAYQTIMFGNIVYDNYAPNIYLSDTTDSWVERNFVYTTGAMTVGSRGGIVMGDERFAPVSQRNTVINNIVNGGSNCFAIWNSMANMKIAHNIFMNCDSDYTIRILAGSHTNTLFYNNIILEETSKAITLLAGTGITYDYNVWSKTPSAAAQGGHNIVGDPLVSKTGNYTSIDYYRLTAGSPAIDAALVLAWVEDDWDGADRPGSNRDCGPFEV